ncbi:hypothetical protein B0J12DRAFT_698605 [Macrophomina phaseolina]|uniref:Uncharacterized protein n=1 Tax=Macrophomina phaseolina TaxID=35725 RepID=A0ABQ8GES1_9PEZI|nr:hypothetical protein B0J12DRAFT_698605 [Macrophomina phaseolina]
MTARRQEIFGSSARNSFSAAVVAMAMELVQAARRAHSKSERGADGKREGSGKTATSDCSSALYGPELRRRPDGQVPRAMCCPDVGLVQQMAKEQSSRAQEWKRRVLPHCEKIVSRRGSPAGSGDRLLHSFRTLHVLEHVENPRMQSWRALRHAIKLPSDLGRRLSQRRLESHPHLRAQHLRHHAFRRRSIKVHPPAMCPPHLPAPTAPYPRLNIFRCRSAATHRRPPLCQSTHTRSPLGEAAL